MAKRKKYSAEFKAKVALEALQGDMTMAQLAAKYGAHPSLIAKWKATAKEGLVGLFSGKQQRQAGDDEARIKELHAKIGELTVEKDFLAKAFGR